MPRVTPVDVATAEGRTRVTAWWRSYPNEHWESVAVIGLVRRPDASIDDIRISAAEPRIAVG